MRWDKGSRNKLNKNKWLYIEKAISTIIILSMIATMFVFIPPTGIEKASAVEAAPPTISGFSVNAGATYANTASRIITASGTFDDDSGGSLKVQFSQDGTNWGVYSGTPTVNNKSTGWTNYITITASASSQDISNAWYLEPPDGSKTIRVRSQDDAGNTSYRWHQTDWIGGSGQTAWSDATKYSSDDGTNLRNSVAGQVRLNTSTQTQSYTYNDTRTSTGYTTTRSKSWATQARATWSWTVWRSQQWCPCGTDYARLYIPSGTLRVSKSRSGSDGSTSGSETTAWYSGNSARVRLEENLPNGASVTLNSVEFSGTLYGSPGTVTSSVKDNGSTDTDYGTLDYSPNSQPSGGSLSVKIRAGNVADTNDESWTGWTTVADGGSLSAFNGKRYIQYQGTLTSDGSANTTMTAITVTGRKADSITLDTVGPAAVVEEDGKTSVGFTDATKVTEIATNSWTADTTPYFSWKASADGDLDVGAPYKVYFGTNSSATAAVDGTAQTATTHNPGTLTEGTYYLKIVAKDLVGNYSATSKDYILKLDTTPPDTSAIIPATTTGFSDTIDVSWGLPVENGSGVDKFYVYWAARNVAAGEPVPTVDETNVYTTHIGGGDITTNTFAHLAPPALGTRTYYYKIKAIDNVGNVSSLSLQGGPGNIKDTDGPGAPTSGPVAAPQINGTMMDVSWGPASDNVGVAEYRVTYSLDDSVYLSAGDPVTSGTSFTHSGLIDNTTYYYKVQAFQSYLPDIYPGSLSTSVSNITPDATNPSAPAWNTIDGSEGYSNSQVNLDWAVPQDLNNDSTTSGTGISGYDIYRASDTPPEGDTSTAALALLTPTFDQPPLNGGTRETGTTYQDSGLPLSYRWYAYKIKAYDNASSHALISTDNASTDSAIIWVRTKKDTQPVGVDNDALTTPAGDPSSVVGVGKRITVSFTGGASKNDELDGYEIYRATTNHATSAEWLDPNKAKLVKTFGKAELAPVGRAPINLVSYKINCSYLVIINCVVVKAISVSVTISIIS